MKSEFIVHPFEPVYDGESRILILGSFPSVVSREQNFYYANRYNRFWTVMSLLFETDITDRRAFCLEKHIALWDVIESCTIEGSSDSSIRNVTVNDIRALTEKTKIHTVFTTGQKASSLYRKYVICDCEHIPLPSTSAANAAMRTDDLVRAYRIIKERLSL